MGRTCRRHGPARVGFLCGTPRRFSDEAANAQAYPRPQAPRADRSACRPCRRCRADQPAGRPPSRQLFRRRRRVA